MQEDLIFNVIYKIWYDTGSGMVVQFYTDTMGLSCIRNIVSPQISHSESKIKVRV